MSEGEQGGAGTGPDAAATPASDAHAPRGPRGPYRKTEERRRQILDQAVVVFARRGYHSGSLREIARGVGMTVPGILHHFGDKESLFQAVLAERDQRVRQAAGDVSEQNLIEQFRAVMRAVADEPGLSSLYTIVSAEATDHEHPAHGDFRERYAENARGVIPALIAGQQDGTVRADLDVMQAARVIPAVMDGLQQQWLLDATFDLETAFDDFLRGYLLPR
ncbi:TetR/AcrR family transcriptional regulator [Schumannella sp. 10F1B-5-1]|uniref:TetR/AcrR family transcriptional regulator n=1 Tax=Schumannella sp. 10F1B-5-1 TaxID=2590780 RepID=UPI0011318D60|nr:TetR family transcriptional regulator [Schumannella sp. 10F1B-5-1]TPW78452.1 TetR family transcriptional regulator [Schumannella sp. 10F1B-5-1]